MKNSLSLTGPDRRAEPSLSLPLDEEAEDEEEEEEECLRRFFLCTDLDFCTGTQMFEILVKEWR